MDQSAANTPGKHSRDHLSPIDAKRADVQLAKANGLAHHSADAANINAQSQNIHASHNGRPHEKQGFMFKIKSAFGCCSSSSV
ncbi:hypothetical protein IW144_003417 [Coemansia sp. RSA 522]|nr:hypothetical protein IW144_003417 [Coemansia sp. RSA 522]